MFKGITVTLYEKTSAGEDGFGREEFEETPVEVGNVLIDQPSSDDVINEINLSGKRIEYLLRLPKGDEHDWTDSKVSFFGKDFRTIGEAYGLQEENVPGKWNKTVKVIAYE